MTINRRTKFRPGSLDSSIIKPETGLLIDQDTGELSGEQLVAEDIILHQRINDLYWKDPLSTLDNLKDKNLENYRVGEAYYIHETQQIYVYVGIVPNLPDSIDTYQPQSWIDANRQEVFLPIPVGLDKDSLATKAYVDQEITNLIDGAPEFLDTLNELAAAINNNPDFAIDILDITASLENRKANIDDVYTKTEVDTKDGAIVALIGALDSKARRLTDYVIGSGAYADNDAVQDLLGGSEVSSQNHKVFYLRKDIVAPPILNITTPGAIFVSFDKEISSLNRVDVSFTDTDSYSDFVIFKDLNIQTLNIESESTLATIYLKNCKLSNLNIAALDSRIILDNCTIYDDISTIGSELKITNSIIGLEQPTLKVLDLNQSSRVEITNSLINGYTHISDTSKLYLRNTAVSIKQSFQCFVLNSQDAFLSLEDTSFISFEGYSVNHIDGSGKLYANLNNYDIYLNSTLDSDGSYTSRIRVGNNINNGTGMPVSNFYLPLGYQDFFYNDERARDTIAQMITNHTLNGSGIIWDYDDTQDTLSLRLNISTGNLTDQANIAYRNQNNTFTGLNTFNTTIAATGGISTTNLIATSATITNLTSITQGSTDNSTKVATTAFVQAKYAELEADIQDLELGELIDVTITEPDQKHVLKYIPAANTIPAQWVNSQLNSWDLEDAISIVRAEDSVFRLADIGRPLFLDQSGQANSRQGSWPSTSQILVWNGEQYDLQGTLTKGGGQWVSGFANDPILKATQEPPFGSNTGYDGWGKIALAKAEEVRDGSNDTKAVVSSLLHEYYASITLSNLTIDQTQLARENIGLPAVGENDHYLIWNNSKWENIDIAKPTYYKDESSASTVFGIRGVFYNITATTLTTFTMPLQEPGDLVVRKNNSIGTIKFTSAASFLTSDNQVLTEFDIVSEGHLVEFKYIPYNGSNIWLAQGYYQSSSNGVIDTEFIQDAAAALFEHQDHAPAIDLNYNDPAHKITLNINYATNAQAIAGTLTNLPVTPASLKAALDASVPEGVLFANNNLSELTNLTTARTNLGLGSAALVNVTNNAGGLLTLNAPLEVGKTIIFNGTGLVSGTSLVSATESTPGVVTLAALNELTNSSDVLTVNWLNTLLNDNSSWLVNLISSISGGGGGGLAYTPMTTQAFTADASKYYSLSSLLGNMIINLPLISSLNHGNRIEFKFTTKAPNTTITINRSGTDTIDKLYTEIELVEEGQHIALVAGINNNWEIA